MGLVQSYILAGGRVNAHIPKELWRDVRHGNIDIL